MPRIVLKILLLLLLHAGAQAQVKFYATLSPVTIHQNEYTTLRIVIENAEEGSQFALPSLQDFSIVSGPNQESGMSSVNGSVTTYKAISYILQPKKAGKINIGPAKLTIQGKVLQTKPLQLVVKNSTGNSAPVQSPVNQGNPFLPGVQDDDGLGYEDFILKPGEDIPAKVAKNMELRAETNKTVCYVGESLVATYNLYTRLKTESTLTGNPAFNGFSVVEIPQNNMEPSPGKLFGRPCNVYTIRKSQLYGLQPGTFTLDAATLENEISFMPQGQSSGSLLDQFMDGLSGANLIRQKVTLTSKPITITVKPLPEHNKPIGFNGAVGKFSVEAHIINPRFALNESGTIVFTISGSGNMKLITLPAIQLPQGVEMLDPVVADNFSELEVPLAGTKEFRIPFTVSSPGAYTIQPIRFSYFDPATATYHTVETSPMGFEVLPAAAASIADTASIATSNENTQPFWKKNKAVWALAPIIALLLLLAFRRKKSKPEVSRTPTTDVKQKQVVQEEELLQKAQEVQLNNPLQEAETLLYQADSSMFYSALYRNIRQFICNKYQIPLSEIHSKKIAYLLDKKGVEVIAANEVEKLLSNLEWKLYAPAGGNFDMKEDYSAAQSALQQLCTHTRKG